jgi:hypothetical protein
MLLQDFCDAAGIVIMGGSIVVHDVVIVGVIIVEALS